MTALTPEDLASLATDAVDLLKTYLVFAPYDVAVLLHDNNGTLVAASTMRTPDELHAWMRRHLVVAGVLPLGPEEQGKMRETADLVAVDGTVLARAGKLR